MKALKLAWIIKFLCAPSFVEQTKVAKWPRGWVAKGLWCITIFHAAPYTQCPTNIDRFRAKPPPKGGMWVVDSGVCGLLDVLSPNITCQRSAAQLSYHKGDAKGVYMPVCSTTGPENQARTSFDVTCPEGYEVETTPVNDYAWNSRSFVRCIRKIRIQGKMWCPKNFIPFGMHHVQQALLNYSGSEQMSENDAIDAVQTSHRDLFLEVLPDWLSPFLKTPSGCAQMVSVDNKSCNEFACRSPYIVEVKSILRNWSHRKLGILDEDSLVSWGIPNGNDLRLPPTPP